MTIPQQTTMGDLIFNIVFWGVIWVLYKSRNASPWNQKVWDGIKWFFIIVLVVLGANYTKKKVKDWWSK